MPQLSFCAPSNCTLHHLAPGSPILEIAASCRQNFSVDELNRSCVACNLNRGPCCCSCCCCCCCGFVDKASNQLSGDDANIVPHICSISSTTQPTLPAVSATPPYYFSPRLTSLPGGRCAVSPHLLAHTRALYR